jgi:hypothetical protein
MPRWLFLLIAAALGLSVLGGVLIFLRSDARHAVGRVTLGPDSFRN